MQWIVFGFLVIWHEILGHCWTHKLDWSRPIRYLTIFNVNFSGFFSIDQLTFVTQIKRTYKMARKKKVVIIMMEIISEHKEKEIKLYPNWLHRAPNKTCDAVLIESTYMGTLYAFTVVCFILLQKPECNAQIAFVKWMNNKTTYNLHTIDVDEFEQISSGVPKPHRNIE